MPESWRLTRAHPVLGNLALHNCNGVWWQSELDLGSGHSIRFDLQAENAPGGVDSEALFTSAADFVRWARQAEPKIKGIVVEKLLIGHYFCRAPGVLSLSQSRGALNRQMLDSRLRLAMLVYCASGTSDWEYQCVDLFGARKVGFMLSADREINTPLNVS